MKDSKSVRVPSGNQNAAKEGVALQVNFYLKKNEGSALRRHLAHKYGREPTKTEMLEYAREQAKNGIYQAIKSELPAIII